MKESRIQHITELNLAILLVSTSGVLGKYITTSPPLTIFWRCVFAALFLGAFIYYKKINIKIENTRDFKIVLLSALLFGAHWITYFYALQLSNVAIGMLSLFTYPIITVLLEPIFFKTKLNRIHVLLGLLVLVGIYFLTPEFSLQNTHTKGLIFGLASSVFYSIRNILIKQSVGKYHGSMLMFYQMIFIAALLLPMPFLYQETFTSPEWGALLVLALVTTAIGHTLFVISFKNFSIGAASIMSSIQPVYGIVFGFLFLQEIPHFKTVIGGTLIILTVVVESLKRNKS